jgi:hypothetical protein
VDAAADVERVNAMVPRQAESFQQVMTSAEQMAEENTRIVSAVAEAAVRIGLPIPMCRGPARQHRGRTWPG